MILLIYILLLKFKFPQIFYSCFQLMLVVVVAWCFGTDEACWPQGVTKGRWALLDVFDGMVIIIEYKDVWRNFV